MDLLDLLADIEAPLWGDCGHKRTHEGTNAHAVECWNLTCPHCGIQEVNAYQLVMGHEPYSGMVERWGTCWPQQWSFERVACCMSCRAPTFGEWPCRIPWCELHVCTAKCETKAGYVDFHKFRPNLENGSQR